MNGYYLEQNKNGHFEEFEKHITASFVGDGLHI